MDDEVAEVEGSGCGGYAILAAAAAGLGAAVYAYSRDGFVILFWVIGAVLLWRAARKINNPSPPPPSGPAPGEDLQFTVVDDPEHPNHSVVKWGRSQRRKGPS